LYYQKYATENKIVVGIGINFDTEKRAVGNYLTEILIA
jgi:biotin-(acetyl-CoA carboxylase) ligase